LTQFDLAQVFIIIIILKVNCFMALNKHSPTVKPWITGGMGCWSASK